MANQQMGDNWDSIANDDPVLNQRYGGGADHDGDSSGSGLRLPKKRKMLLGVIALVTAINVILTILATIYPVPTFNTSGGLLQVTATYPNSSDSVNSQISSQRRWITFEEERRLLARAPGHGDTAVVTEFWDEGCGCMQTVTSTEVETRYSTKIVHPTTTIQLESETASPQATGGTRSPSGATDNNSTVGDGNTGISVEQGSFAALFLGVSGGCLQRRSGVLVCTSSSFIPDFQPIYQQAGLAENVTAQLPSDTGGASIGLLVAIISFVFTFIAFGVSLLPKQWTYGPQNYAGVVDLRHQWAIAFATFSGTVSMFSVVASVITLRNTFGASAAAVEAWDATQTLSSSLLSAFSVLYAASILSGLVVISGLSLIAWDFKNPWFFNQLKKRENPWSSALPPPVFDAPGRNYVRGTTAAGSTMAGGTSGYTSMGTPRMSGMGTDQEAIRRAMSSYTT